MSQLDNVSMILDRELSTALTPKDLQHIYDCVSDQINAQMDRWEASKYKDEDLDHYIDELCDVRDKVSKILNNPLNRTF